MPNPKTTFNIPQQVNTGGLGVRRPTTATVTQATNRSTGVTLNAASGTITTNNASLAAESSADFIVTNSYVGANDVVVVSVKSGMPAGGTTNNTIVSVIAVGTGTFTIRVSNGNVAAGTAETAALVINFVVIKGYDY
jgi:hypothetical protein